LRRKYAPGSALGKAVDQARRDFCDYALWCAQGNVTEAARICGIHRSYMNVLIAEYRLKVIRPNRLTHAKPKNVWQHKSGADHRRKWVGAFARPAKQPLSAAHPGLALPSKSPKSRDAQHPQASRTPVAQQTLPAPAPSTSPAPA
jgi:hypothetical protein